MSLRVTFLIFLVIGLITAIAIYVYKDAKEQNMNPLLWVLVVIFVPNFLGIVIYLIVRSTSQKKSICYQCGKSVENDYEICPYCKTDLTMHCKACGKVLNPEWKTCPNCGQVIGEQITMVPKKNKRLGIIIALAVAVIILPIIIFVSILFISNFTYNEFTVEKMAVENNIGRDFNYGAMSFSGKKIDNININRDGKIKIDCFINYESGELNATLYNADGETVHTFTLNGEENFILDVKKGEDYQFELKGNQVKNVKVGFNWDYIE